MLSKLYIFVTYPKKEHVYTIIYPLDRFLKCHISAFQIVEN